MISILIEASVRHRVFVIAAAVALLLGGLYAFRHLNIEAYPDPSSPIVEIIAQNPGWSAEEMERQITIPLETQLNGMAKLQTIRSISLFGLSNVKCYFTWETDYWAARQEVLNRLQSANLPAGVQPQLSPWSALGEIYRYQLVGEGYNTMELKEAQDWILERQFRQVPGIIDVISFGGPTKEFHVDLDPNKMIAFGVSIADVMQAIGNSNSNVGGNYLQTGEQSYNIRGVGLLRDVEDIGNVLVAERGGTPLYVRQLGEVRIGNKVLLGKVGKDNNPDIVQGIVMMHRGQQTLPTLEGVHRKVEEINAGGILPPGMRIVPYYDRTDLIEVTTSTVEHVLLAGMVLVGFIMIAFLGDLRAALVVTLSIPLALLLTFVVMVARGYSANLISMGALDFGIIIDASVIMVENIHRRLSQADPRGGARVSLSVVEAAKDVAAPIFFSMAVIIAAFIPLFTMQGVEGRIFGPLAVTYGIALSAALFLSMTYAPALSSWLLKRGSGHSDTVLVRWLSRVYSPVLRGCLSRPFRTVAVAALAMALGFAAVPFLGGEFMPKLEEGNLWVRAALPNDISLEYASQITDQIRARIKTYPEVTTVVSQLGRPDDGTDAVSWFNTEMFVNLQPREKWRKGITKQELVRQMAADLKQIPGVTYNFSQNIQDNVNEAMSGVKGENSIKIFGDDLETLESVGQQIKDVMRGVPGVTDAGVFAMLGQPNLLISVDRQRAARYGLLANDVNRVVQAAVGGQAVTQVLDGERRFDLVVRLLPEYRSTAEAIRNIPISTRTGRIPLREVADVVSQPGASFIYREGNARYLPIKFSVRGRDLKSTIADAESRIHKSVQLPPGFRLKWAGEFQQLQDALDRLMIVVPITLCVIFALLYGYFQSLLNSLIVLGSVPLALLGGVFALLVSRTDLSISATVGFICVLGVVILNGVVLVARVNTLRAEGRPLYEAVVDASHLRLRAVMMVSAAAGIGLLPAAIATGIGSETQQPLARVVVGSMVTAPIATLLVLPALYLVVNRWMDARVGRRVAETIPGGALAGE
jgi:cobalt-zinc-cadmium resistance protein CzcA